MQKTHTEEVNIREQRACLNKKTFYKKKIAKRAAMHSVSIYRNGKIKPYKCEYCRNYHIGHDRMMHTF